MKTVIIFLNILLISLLLYYFLTKTNTLIENLANCPTDKRNVIYKQSAKSIIQGKKLNKLQFELNMLKPRIALNTLLAKSAGKKGKKAIGDVKKKGKEKENELNKLDKGFAGGKKGITASQSAKDFGKAMRASKETSMY